MDELLQAVLKSYGVVGLVMFSPLIAVVFLWRDNVRLNNEMRQMTINFTEKIDDMGKRVVASQEKRVDESHAITNQLVELISTHTASAKESALALDRVGDLVSMLMAQFNGMQGQLPPRRSSGG
jgi:hypothetical protein